MIIGNTNGLCCLTEFVYKIDTSLKNCVLSGTKLDDGESCILQVFVHQWGGYNSVQRLRLISYSHISLHQLPTTTCYQFMQKLFIGIEL